MSDEKKSSHLQSSRGLLLREKVKQAFYGCITQGQLERCKTVLKQYLALGGEARDLINAKDARQRTPLHLAILNNKVEIFNWLLSDEFKTVININATNAVGCSALHIAALHNRWEMLHRLTEDPRIDKELLDKDGNNYLIYAFTDSRSDCKDDLSDFISVEFEHNQFLRFILNSRRSGQLPAYSIFLTPRDSINRFVYLIAELQGKRIVFDEDGKKIIIKQKEIYPEFSANLLPMATLTLTANVRQVELFAKISYQDVDIFLDGDQLTTEARPGTRHFITLACMPKIYDSNVMVKVTDQPYSLPFIVILIREYLSALEKKNQEKLNYYRQVLTFIFNFNERTLDLDVLIDNGKTIRAFIEDEPKLAWLQEILKSNVNRIVRHRIITTTIKTNDLVRLPILQDADNNFKDSLADYSLDQLLVRNENLMNALHIAASLGHVDFFNAYLERYRELNTENSTIAGQGYNDIINLRSGVGFTVLHHAIRGDNWEMFTLLMQNKAEYGVDIDAIDPALKITPLILAAKYGRKKYIKKLIDAGACTEFTDAFGYSYREHMLASPPAEGQQFNSPQKREGQLSFYLDLDVTPEWLISKVKMNSLFFEETSSLTKIIYCFALLQRLRIKWDEEKKAPKVVRLSDNEAIQFPSDNFLYAAVRYGTHFKSIAFLAHLFEPLDVYYDREGDQLVLEKIEGQTPLLTLKPMPKLYDPNARIVSSDSNKITAWGDNTVSCLIREYLKLAKAVYKSEAKEEKTEEEKAKEEKIVEGMNWIKEILTFMFSWEEVPVNLDFTFTDHTTLRTLIFEEKDLGWLKTLLPEDLKIGKVVPSLIELSVFAVKSLMEDEKKREDKKEEERLRVKQFMGENYALFKSISDRIDNNYRQRFFYPRRIKELVTFLEKFDPTPSAQLAPK